MWGLGKLCQAGGELGGSCSESRLVLPVKGSSSVPKLLDRRKERPLCLLGGRLGR